MISTKQLCYEIDMRLNKLTSSEFQSIPLEDKLIALNEAQIKLIKKKISGNNTYGYGLDTFKKRYEDLQTLVEPFEELSTQKSMDNDAYTSYLSSINSLKHKYFVPLDMYTLCSKGDCKNRALYISRIVKHGDLSTLMSNNHYVPSFEYQEGLALISNNEVYIYTDGTFTVDKLYLSYIRYPQQMDLAGYEHLDGAASTDIDCELVEYLKDELLDLTCLELGMDTQNAPAIQEYEIRNKITE